MENGWAGRKSQLAPIAVPAPGAQVLTASPESVPVLIVDVTESLKLFLFRTRVTKVAISLCVGLCSLRPRRDALFHQMTSISYWRKSLVGGRDAAYAAIPDSAIACQAIRPLDRRGSKSGDCDLTGFHSFPTKFEAE